MNYENIHGTFAIKRVYESTQNFNNDNKESNNNYTQLDDEYELRNYGYCVAKKGPTNLERERLLVFLIEYKLMSKSKIKWWIEEFINRMDSGLSYIIQHWESDLKFINEYDKNR